MKLNKDVFHKWAHQTKPSGRRGNVYFEGDTIYSYGSHFPMARHTTDERGKPCILMTSRTYSSTTSGHMSAVRSAIPEGIPVFHMEYPQSNPCQNDIDERIKVVQRLREACMRRRDHWQWEIDRMDDALNKIQNFAHAFKLKFKDKPSKEWKAFLVTLPEKIQKRENYLQWLKDHPTEANLAAEKRRADAFRLKQAKFEREAGEWFAGTRGQFPALPGTGRRRYYGRQEAYLRICPKDPSIVATSQNASVPLEHVKKVLPLVLSLINNGKTYRKNGHSIHLGDYVLDEITAEGTVVAGCHRFPKSEVLRFAKIIAEV